MKEQYFSPASIERKAEELCQPFETERRKRLQRFAPMRSALLVLDMQLYFLVAGSHAWVPSGEAIIPGIRALVQAYGRKNLPVIFTRHINTPDNAGMMKTWWKELIRAENPLSEITPALDMSSGRVVNKSQYDAFYNTPLEEMLQGRGVTQVVICGVMTHLCCETTARSAFMRGYEVYFTVDGTASYNENFHRASLLNLSHGYATLALVKEILQGFGEDDD